MHATIWDRDFRDCGGDSSWAEKRTNHGGEEPTYPFESFQIFCTFDLDICRLSAHTVLHKLSLQIVSTIGTDSLA